MTIRSNSPYIPSFLKEATKDVKSVQASYSDFNLADSNHGNDDSFKYDPLGYPLKSTQQLNLDWSKFENHCFFSSAEVKVNEAFNKIINSYPFDGTKKESEQFLDSLTGFEKWIFDKFPTWSGALHFSGSNDPAQGNWIAVKDKSGNMYPELAKNNSGTVVLNPGDDDSFTIEALIKIPAQSNDTQVVFQKLSSQTDGITFHIASSLSSLTSSAVFSISSGSTRNSVSYDLQKGVYNHICLTLNKTDTTENSLQLYVNEALVSESSNKTRFKKIDIDEADFLIGSGSSFYSTNSLVTPTQTFSGTLDELRVFHSIRDLKQQIIYASRGLYSTPELKLYYRFNEPSGSLSISSGTDIDTIVLDSSGNSLHSNVNNLSFNRRINVKEDLNNMLTNERKEFQTILFPAYQDILDLNMNLLVSASDYDRNNPNNILKLIPQHYLLEGASQDGFSSIEGNGGDPYGGEGIPGQGKKGPVQIILSFLYIWSKFFDEIKTYIDSFVTLKTVGYNLEDTIPDNFLEDLSRNYGFYFPKFFNNSSLEQFSEGQNIANLSDIETTLKKIQSTIHRRVLINMPDIVKSKGTQHSIKAFLRSVGVDPENSIRIREYGGSKVKQLTASREKRIESFAMTAFTSNALVYTDPLSGSRKEPGFPYPEGDFYVNQISGKNEGTTCSNDGLLTSGSWTAEAIFKLPPQKISDIVDTEGNQSLFRLECTGSAFANGPSLVANVVATQFVKHPRQSSTVQAFIRPGYSSSAPVLNLSLSLDGNGIFDGDRWNISLGCTRNDEFESEKSSSYYLRAAKSDSDGIVSLYETSSFFYEDPQNLGNVFRSGSLSYNASGSYICIGNGQNIPSGIPFDGHIFLNDTTNVDDIARTKDYAGWAANLRFWSKTISIDEWKEHVRNPKSVGVDNPLANYNFVTNVSGSFQKLRLDTLQKQAIRNTDSLGTIDFLDFSQNNLVTTGIGFLTSSKVITGDLFSYSYLSPMFDEAATDDKIRIRSFQNFDSLAENPDAILGPTYMNKAAFDNEESQDDLRLSLEFSMVDSLDKDIISMFSSLDFLGDALGSPEMMFSPDYIDLEKLRDVYFNRLSGKPDFRKFLEFYRWFDDSISSFIDQIIPSKTRYKGTNYVIESHMLERHKNTYRHSGNYLGVKQVIDDSLLVQQIVGKLKKY